MTKKLRKAVFPVAGLGTRLLPATKAIPKELLTVVDRPLIQYAVDEAREAGIEQLIFVTGRGKSTLVDYFDMAFELETTMREKGKSLGPLESSRVHFGELVSVRQQQPLGLGHAVWCAREIVGNEPFAVLLPDVLVQAKRSCLAQMIDAYNELGEKANVLAVEPISPEVVHMYGVVGVGPTKGKAFQVTGMVEKPPRGTAPSNLHITGRYILQPTIFNLLAHQEKGAGGEIQLTDSMIALSRQEAFHAVRFDGDIYDTGSKIGFLTANIAYALDRADLGPELRAEIEKLIER